MGQAGAGDAAAEPHGERGTGGRTSTPQVGGGRRVRCRRTRRAGAQTRRGAPHQREPQPPPCPVSPTPANGAAAAPPRSPRRASWRLEPGKSGAFAREKALKRRILPLAKSRSTPSSNRGACLRLLALATFTAPPAYYCSTIGRGIYFGHFRLKSLRLHRSAAKKSRQRLWHDDAASARFQPSSGRGRRSRWRAPPRSVGEFVCSWGHHSGRHALALLRCDGSAATKTSWRCAPSRRAHPPPALRHARKGPRDPQAVSPPDFSAR